MKCQLGWGGNTNPTHQPFAIKNMEYMYKTLNMQFKKEAFTIHEIQKLCLLVLRSIAYRLLLHTNKYNLWFLFIFRQDIHFRTSQLCIVKAVNTNPQCPCTLTQTRMLRMTDRDRVPDAVSIRQTRHGACFYRKQAEIKRTFLYVHQADYVSSNNDQGICMVYFKKCGNRQRCTGKH